MIDKLIKIQGELKAPKSQNNTFGKYKYRSCEDILEAVKPLLVREGLLMTISDSIENVGARFYVKADITVTDGTNTVKASAMAREPEIKKGMDEPQITGTASSYARKYALNGLFCIDDTKDSDTDEYRNESESRYKAKKQQTKPKEQPPAQPPQIDKNAALHVFVNKSKRIGLDPDAMAALVQFKFGAGATSKTLTPEQAQELANNFEVILADFDKERK